MWHPIASADLTRACWSTVADIESALGAHIDGASRLNPHLSGGTAGFSLFFAYLHAAGASEGAGDRALDTLERSINALSERHLIPPLYAGFTGIGWVMAHLTRELFEGDGDATLAVDEALRQLLAEVNEPPPHELLGGLAGYGSYLIERLPNAGAEELLHRIVGVLETSRDKTGTWYTNPEWLPDWQRELMPDGCHNLGVAHGIPGVIGFLAAAKRAGLADPRLAPLAHDAVQWLLTQKGTWPSSVFPAHVPPNDAPRPTRTAWCYGDLGIAAVLLLAARSFGRADWQAEALAIARLAAARTPEETRVTDVGLCHGATGIAHLFNRFHQATNDDGMRQAAERWYRIALDMRRPGEGIAGFIGWADTGRPGEGEWRGEPGFLSGVAGIGLALLAAVSDVEPAWDRVMVLS